MIINSNSDEDSSEEEAKANRLNSLTTKHWEHGVLVESVQPMDQQTIEDSQNDAITWYNGLAMLQKVKYADCLAAFLFNNDQGILGDDISREKVKGIYRAYTGVLVAAHNK